MKRGLVLESAELYPATEWTERLGHVQQELTQRNLDWALVYGDVSAADDISYLTNICVYWNEGVLAIPRAGLPIFVTRLSARVFPWMERTSTVNAFRSGPNIAKEVSEVIDGSVAIVDESRWPTALLHDFRSRLDARVSTIDGLISSLRATPSEAEISTLGRLGGWLAGAITAGQSAGEVEFTLRRAGCTDVLIDTRSTSTEFWAQYGHLWVRAGRDAGVLGEAAAAAMGTVETRLRPGVGADELASAIATPNDVHAAVSIIPSSHFTGLGELTSARTPKAGTVVTVVIELLGLGTSAHVSDTFLLTETSAQALTTQNGAS